MTEKTWTLLDAEKSDRPEVSITPQDAPGRAEGYRIESKRLRGGLSDGVDTVRVDNGRLAFTVLPTRGMSVWKAWLGDDTQGELGWRSPVRGPVHPCHVPLAEPGGLGWLDGFDEMLVRCGLESNGAPDFDDRGRLTHPLHGRIGNRPAHFVEVGVDGETGRLRVTGVVEETRFHFTKLRLTSTISTESGQAGFHVRDTVQNLSDSPATMQLLYHVNFGRPLLDAGSALVAPAEIVVPRDARAAEDIDTWRDVRAEQPGYQEQVYFLRMLSDENGRTKVLLRNSRATRAVVLGFDTAQLPCFTLWKNTTSRADGYVVGLEPGTNFPNPRSFESRQDRVVRLDPGEERTWELTFEALDSTSDIERMEAEIDGLRQGTEPRVHELPQPGWCHGVAN